MRIEIMPPAVRHYCKSDRPNTGIWCEPNRDAPIKQLYTYTYKCLGCGQTFQIQVQKI